MVIGGAGRPSVNGYVIDVDVERYALARRKWAVLVEVGTPTVVIESLLTRKS